MLRKVFRTGRWIAWCIRPGAAPIGCGAPTDLYLDLYSKAAALLDSLVSNYAFVDGNKRTAITNAGLFLRINGYRLTANNQQVESFTLQCAQRLIPLEKIELWLKDHTEKTT